MSANPIHRRALIVLAKPPIAGRAKTRLCPPLTLDEAARFAAAALADTVAVARSVPGCRVILAHPPGALPALRAALGDALPEPCVIPPGDVGEAMDGAMRNAFAGGATHVALIGSDLPSLPPAYITAAFAALDTGADVALGPAEDGGYYLIATVTPRSALFRGIAWSTGAVFAQTVAQIAADGLTLAALPSWYDVDSATDLLRCARELGADPLHPATATRAFLPTVEYRLRAAVASGDD